MSNNYAEYHHANLVMPSVIYSLNGIILNVAIHNVIVLNVFMLRVVILIVMPSVVMLSDAECCYIDFYA